MSNTPSGFSHPLSEVDPEIAAVLDQELARQQGTLEMIAVARLLTLPRISLVTGLRSYSVLTMQMCSLIQEPLLRQRF
jgi:hypothetical protein